MTGAVLVGLVLGLLIGYRLGRARAEAGAAMHAIRRTWAHRHAYRKE